MNLPGVVAFVLEIDRLKHVTRKIRLRGDDRFENTAEHSWQIAMLAAALEPFAPEPVDMSRVIMMLLVHDIGEIETGDTIFFAEDGLAERKAAELAAIERIFGLLDEPQRSQFVALWKEFEAAETPESRFANAADRAMPVLLNLANAGQSWRENGISYEKVIGRVGPPIRRGCPRLWSYLESRIEEARAAGWFASAGTG